MGTRPLRQYYDGVSVEVDDDLGSLVEPWLRHRRRFATSLASLTDEPMEGPRRGARLGRPRRREPSRDRRRVLDDDAAAPRTSRSEPTTFIRGFDPSTGTDDMVAAMLELPDRGDPRAVRRGDRHVRRASSSRSPTTTGMPWAKPRSATCRRGSSWVTRSGTRGCTSATSSQPLGLAPAIEPDEVLARTWYALVVGGLQGGLLGDAAPVGPGAGAADRRDAPVRRPSERSAAGPDRLRRARSTRADGTNAVAAGSAVDLVEGTRGRACRSTRSARYRPTSPTSSREPGSSSRGPSRRPFSPPRQSVPCLGRLRGRPGTRSTMSSTQRSRARTTCGPCTPSAATTPESSCARQRLGPFDRGHRVVDPADHQDRRRALGVQARGRRVRRRGPERARQREREAHRLEATGSLLQARGPDRRVARG